MIKEHIVQLIEKENFWYLFALLCLISILSLYVVNDIIITDPQYFTGGNQNSVSLYRKIYLVIYFIYPIYCFAKVATIAGLLNFGLQHIKIKTSFKQLMLVTIIAQLVYWIQDFAQMVWFLFIHKDYTMKEVDNFSFFSLQYFISPETSGAFKSLVNFFSFSELLYCITLIIGLQILTKESCKRMAKVVLYTYLLAMLILLLAKSFFLHKMTL